MRHRHESLDSIGGAKKRRTGQKQVWHEIASPLNDPALQARFPEAARNTRQSEAYIDLSGLRVILSIEKLPDGREYQHVSVSREDRYPSWEELLEIKSEFMGDDVEAYQVFPRVGEYINVHPNCFHLWRCLEADLMPH